MRRIAGTVTGVRDDVRTVTLEDGRVVDAAVASCARHLDPQIGAPVLVDTGRDGALRIIFVGQPGERLAVAARAPSPSSLRTANVPYQVAETTTEPRPEASAIDGRRYRETLIARGVIAPTMDDAPRPSGLPALRLSPRERAKFEAEARARFRPWHETEGDP